MEYNINKRKMSVKISNNNNSAHTEWFIFLFSPIVIYFKIICSCPTNVVFRCFATKLQPSHLSTVTVMAVIHICGICLNFSECMWVFENQTLTYKKITISEEPNPLTELLSSTDVYKNQTKQKTSCLETQSLPDSSRPLLYQCYMKDTFLPSL